MKRLTLAALAAVLGVSLAAAGLQEKKPVNKMCPVMTDHKVDTKVTVLHKGKVIGLCCTDCAKKWGNGAAFEKNIKDDYGTPDMPEGADTVKGAVEGGKAGGYMVAALFADKSAKTTAFMNLLLGVLPELRLRQGRVQEGLRGGEALQGDRRADPAPDRPHEGTGRRPEDHHYGDAEDPAQGHPGSAGEGGQVTRTRNR